MKKTIASGAIAAFMAFGGTAVFAGSIIQISEVTLGTQAGSRGVAFESGVGVNVGHVYETQSALNYEGPSLPFGKSATAYSIESVGSHADGISSGTVGGLAAGGAQGAGFVGAAQRLQAD